MMPLGRILACALLAGACAQAAAPPGGDPDRYAPVILSSVPDTNAIVPGFTGPVVFKFDETLSERGVREDDMALVSPETGKVEIQRKGDEVRVEIEGGWQPGRIYHVTVLPGIQDRFGNPRPHAYELVFSTGPEIPSNAVAGLVQDRLTNRAVANARVRVTSVQDSTMYVTLTDTAGFFAMRSLPFGPYRVTAFLDQNRNREIDYPEALDMKVVSILTARDTSVVELSVLAPDTTPARLLRAEAADTTSVRIAFDDFIPPDEVFDNVTVSLWQLPDSISVPAEGVVMHPRAYEARVSAMRDSAAARADTTKADTTRANAAARRPAPAVRQGMTPTASAGAADTVSLPTQDLIFAPTRPLTPATRYRILVNGIRNMLRLPGGGGSVTFETPARPRPAAPSDSTTVPGDTTAAPPAAADTTQRR